MFKCFIQCAHTKSLMYMMHLWNKQGPGSFQHINSVGLGVHGRAGDNLLELNGGENSQKAGGRFLHRQPDLGTFGAQINQHFGGKGAQC